jgi:hypothetical protein
MIIVTLLLPFVLKEFVCRLPEDGEIITPKHVGAIPINQPTKCKNFLSSLLDVYVELNMFRASSSPSSKTQKLQ